MVNMHIPYNYERMLSDLVNLLHRYPIASGEYIGHSVLGKPIPHIIIGHGKKKIHINASFHANEWITTNVVMKFMEDYLHAIYYGQSLKGIDARTLYQETSLSIVPMVNPDGVNLVLDGPPIIEPYYSNILKINKEREGFTGWKANIRGVDLNNQFPANWEIEKERKIPKKPAPRDYPGRCPLSEPEAITMVRLAKRWKFDRVVALHTQGEEFYWGYMENEPSEAVHIANEFERVSGYRAVRTIDSHAGYKDWFILHYKRAGFTIELGKGINPLPLSMISGIYERTFPLLLASMYV
ncbi:M14 family metallopeptidase [Metabacillus iocasae]|uniref:G-D-glutamyl-meso-diaminopimelate peptidase n=1 Tax=Priestia iocasae TaxID=2291674 RepID=A0ABS2QQ08_9BACI|nr:M14 family metallocarboxypeptidase [Metabacillus iocasae]MBM7701537.1 g-D-glutamyl-meso-diaminopimelate peptidase [Metabacillus iocasae]